MSDLYDAPLLMVRTPKGFGPVGAFEDEILDQLPIGSQVEVTVKRRRSGANHRHFFMFLGRLIKAGAVPYTDTDAFLAALKLQCDFVTAVRKMDGTMLEVPRSIAYTKAGELEFQAFKQSALAEIATRYGFTPEDIR